MMLKRIVDELPYYTHVSTEKKSFSCVINALETMNLPKEEWYYEFNGLFYITVYFKKQEYLSWFLLQGK